VVEVDAAVRICAVLLDFAAIMAPGGPGIHPRPSPRRNRSLESRRSGLVGRCGGSRGNCRVHDPWGESGRQLDPDPGVLHPRRCPRTDEFRGQYASHIASVRDRTATPNHPRRRAVPTRPHICVPRSLPRLDGALARMPHDRYTARHSVCNRGAAIAPRRQRFSTHLHSSRDAEGGNWPGSCRDL
jgi:hypothetical protein